MKRNLKNDPSEEMLEDIFQSVEKIAPPNMGEPARKLANALDEYIAAWRVKTCWELPQDQKQTKRAYGLFLAIIYTGAKRLLVNQFG